MLSEEDREALVDLGGCSRCIGGDLVFAVEAIVARHVAVERQHKNAAVRERDEARVSAAGWQDAATAKGEQYDTLCTAVLTRAEWHETKADKARRFRPEIDGENPIMDKAAQVHDDAARGLRALLDDPDAALRAVKAQALRDAADEIARIRRDGLDPGMESHPVSESFERWLRERADRIEGGDA